jgi:hypothetical protein
MILAKGEGASLPARVESNASGSNGSFGLRYESLMDQERSDEDAGWYIVFTPLGQQRATLAWQYS